MDSSSSSSTSSTGSMSNDSLDEVLMQTDFEGYKFQPTYSTSSGKCDSSSSDNSSVVEENPRLQNNNW